MKRANFKKVVGYARVSSESQIDNTSIKEQRERIKAYCSAHRWELDKIFVEEGKSAKSSKKKDRPAYNEMLEYAKENGIEAIVVLKADRLHRRLRNLLELIEDELEPNNIAFISVSESFDTSSAQGMLFLQMIGSFAEFERKIIKERMQSGRTGVAKEGKHAGGSMPYGYKVDKQKGIQLIEEEARIVKRIFTERLEGDSLYKIAKRLNNEGIKTKRGGEWSVNPVKNILKNIAYTGSNIYDGVVEKNGIQQKGVFPRIISKQLFNKVQN